jgi:hypothetical protein
MSSTGQSYSAGIGSGYGSQACSIVNDIAILDSTIESQGDQEGSEMGVDMLKRGIRWLALSGSQTRRFERPVALDVLE